MKRLPYTTRALLLGSLSALLSLNALAQTSTGTRASTSEAPANTEAATDTPPEVKQALPQARLLGKTRLTVWGFQVYDARLWAPAGFGPNSYANQALALELSYLRAFSASDIAARSLQEMRRSANISEEQATLWTREMLRVIPNVQKGDRILGVHQPGVCARFWFNGKPQGEIKDTEFARLFFGIWLSPKTSEPQMRERLLGLIP